MHIIILYISQDTNNWSLIIYIYIKCLLFQVNHGKSNNNSEERNAFLTWLTDLISLQLKKFNILYKNTLRKNRPFPLLYNNNNNNNTFQEKQ